MKLTHTQKLAAVLTVLALVLAVTAAVVAFAGGSMRAKPLFTGSERLAGPEIPKLVFEGSPTEEEDAELSEIYNLRGKFPEYSRALMPFYESSIRQVLSAHDSGNQVYSPLNLYMALSMAAEITDGSTRGQILGLLGAPDIDALREQSRDIWLVSSLSVYGSETYLNNSIWLNNEIDYKAETLDVLADEHFAESFRGEPGTEEYNRLLRDWTNEKTKGLLEDSVNGLGMDDDMLMTLMSTVYFKAAWFSPFAESLTAPDTFHAPDGDVSCDFMHKSWTGSLYRGKHFRATDAYFQGGGNMTFILPDEDSGIDQLLEEGSDFWDFLGWLVESRADDEIPMWKNHSRAIINMSMPKFDVSSDNELTEPLQALGLTEMFDYNVSNFEPLMHNDIPAYISEVNHAARVMVDEEGCTAASYVQMDAEAGAAAPPAKEVDFILDRPFIFIIQTGDGMPLFAGVVNHP